MTVAVTPLAAAVILLVGSVAARGAPDPRSARVRAAGTVLAAAGAVVASMIIAGLVGSTQPPGPAHRVEPDGPHVALLLSGNERWMPLVTCLAGLAATALAPVRSHRRRTLCRILVVLAAGAGATAVDHPLALVISWALAAFVVWREMREHTGDAGPARLFAVHHLLGVGACAAGLAADTAFDTRAAVFLLVVGVAVRQCVVPLHLWYAPFFRTAPAGLVVAFAAGPAGLLLLPEVAETLPGRSWVVGAAALSAVLAAALGLVARDVRTALAQIGLALSGMVSCGMLVGSEVAGAGATLAWQAGTVAAGGAMMIAAATEARRGPMLLAGHGGCFARTPRLAVAFLLFGLTAIGYPATVGFVWEDVLLDGVGEWFLPLAVALVVAVAAAGATVMKWFFAGYTGRRDHSGEDDLTPREVHAVAVLLGALFLGEAIPAALVG